MGYYNTHDTTIWVKYSDDEGWITETDWINGFYSINDVL